MDIVFYGNSLNYDQGIGNYQVLKKITKWDGKQYVFVSRYALRYSILHWANKLFPDKWKLAGKDELSGHSKPTVLIQDFPELDLFGFMIVKNKGSDKNKDSERLTRTSPVKISHAISLTPYNYDTHFMANLDISRRRDGPDAGSNPVIIEEKKDFYAYNVVIDVERVGKDEEDINKSKDEQKSEKKQNEQNEQNKRNERIIQLVETILNLKREIKGRMEDLSPWLLICGLYNNGKYETYLDKIELAKYHIYKIITKEKETRDNEGRIIKEIQNEISEKDAPKFIIDIDINRFKPKIVGKEEIIDYIKKFLDSNDSKSKILAPEILIYKKQFVQTEPTFES